MMGQHRGLGRLVEQLRLAAREPLHDGSTDGQLLQRFRAHRDSAAFEELIRRHGRAVLLACCRQLREPHDVEDCFQAVWLVLARKVGTIRKPELLAGWLYGVARRTALELKASAARRRIKETQAARPEAVQPDAQGELRELIDRELARLPEPYRTAVLTCDVQGLSYKEAARRLGWPEGTLAGRLARARALLARRLARQGISVTGGAMALALAAPAEAVVPAALAETTAQAAVLFAVGKAAVPGIVSSKAILLAQGVLHMMHMTKLKIASIVLLALLAAAGVGGGFMPFLAGDEPGLERAGNGKPGAGNLGNAAVKGDKPGSSARLNRDAEDKLAAAIKLDLKDVPLEDALEEFRKRSGMNVWVNWQDLQGQGVAKEHPITLRIEGMPARTALRVLLRSADLGYFVEDGVLNVTTHQASQQMLVRRIYPVADLVASDTKAENLIEVITASTGRENWASLGLGGMAGGGGLGGVGIGAGGLPGGGGSGTIVYFAEGRSLVVNQTTDVQEPIGQLLEELRASRPAQHGK
jgi:RNA polymerase sigma factor (sigma-70 family)